MVWFLSFSPQGGLDGDSKDDLDSGDENEGRKLDTEDVRFFIIEDIPIGHTEESLPKIFSSL